MGFHFTVAISALIGGYFSRQGALEERRALESRTNYAIFPSYDFENYLPFIQIDKPIACYCPVVNAIYCIRSEGLSFPKIDLINASYSTAILANQSGLNNCFVENKTICACYHLENFSYSKPQWIVASATKRYIAGYRDAFVYYKTFTGILSGGFLGFLISFVMGIYSLCTYLRVRNVISHSKKSKTENAIQKLAPPDQHLQPPREFNSEFLCAFSGKIMRYPVIASDGKHYEQRIIMRYLRDNRYHCLSPITKEPLKKLGKKWVKNDWELQNKIEIYLQNEAARLRVKPASISSRPSKTKSSLFYSNQPLRVEDQHLQPGMKSI